MGCEKSWSTKGTKSTNNFRNQALGFFVNFVSFVDSIYVFSWTEILGNSLEVEHYVSNN